jgi:tetratricopeptide (TPR) repeat protein
MKKYLILISFFVSGMAYGQQREIDSLKGILNTSTSDSIKLDVLSQLTFIYQDFHLDSMVYYAEQSVILCVKNKAVLPDSVYPNALSVLAYTLWYAGNYPDAEETYFKALHAAEPLKDSLLTASIYNGLAVVNRNEGNFRQAINYYLRAMEFAKNPRDNDYLMAALADLGKSYEQLNILDSAFATTQDCLSMILRKYHGNNVIGGGIHASMGIIYSKLGNEKLAEEYFRLSFKLSAEVNNQRLLARSYEEFAEHFYRFHHVDSAILYATKAIQMDEQKGFLVYQLSASALLSKLYQEKNKIDSAFKYQNIMIATRDSLFSNEKLNRIQTLQFNEQLREQQQQIEEEKAKETHQRNLQYAAIAVGIITFIILFFVFSRSIVVKEKFISFFGVLGLLAVFEFINLLIHPYLETFTKDSPVLMLLILIGVGALLIPLHHKLEKWITEKMVEKNKAIRLAAAKKTIAKLEKK